MKWKTFSHPEHLHSTTSTLGSILSIKSGTISTLKMWAFSRTAAFRCFLWHGQKQKWQSGRKTECRDRVSQSPGLDKRLEAIFPSVGLFLIRHFCLFQHLYKQIKNKHKSSHVIQIFFRTFCGGFFHPKPQSSRTCKKNNNNSVELSRRQQHLSFCLQPPLENLPFNFLLKLTLCWTFHLIGRRHKSLCESQHLAVGVVTNLGGGHHEVSVPLVTSQRAYF